MIDLLNVLLIDYIKENNLKFFIYLICILLIFPLESAYISKLYGDLFDAIGKTGLKLNSKFDNAKHILERTPKGLILLIIIVWFVITFLYYLKTSVQEQIIPYYPHYLRCLILNNLIDTHRDNYKDIQAGKLIGRVLSVTTEIKDALDWNLSQAIPEMLACIVLICYLFYLEPNVGGIMLFTFLLIIILLYSSFSYVFNASVAREKTQLEMCENITDNFDNLLQIYINSQENEAKDLNNNFSKIYANKLSDQKNKEKNVSIITQIIGNIGYATSLLYIYNRFEKKEITTSKFITTILVLGNFLSYMLSNTSGIVTFCIAKLGTIQESLSFLREILKKKRNRTLTNVIKDGNIEFKNITFSYSEGSKNILNNVNFKINKQEKVAIIGRSGSGKTTCMKMLIGIHQPNSGNIYVDNKNIKDIKFDHLRENVVYINQRTNLFQDSVLNNIKFGNTVTTKEIEHVIKKYQLETIYAGLNEGLETNTGVNGGNLSLGMQKITILLRGIFKESKIIIFDEPLAGLDANTRQKIIKLITEYCSDKTVIVITHDKEILPYMNRIINISDLNNKSQSTTVNPMSV